VLDSLPPTRRRLAAGAVLLAVVLVLAGRHLAGAGTASPAPAPVAPIRADAGPALVVHVVGAVHRPGLYRFGGRSRVADAVARAGGATRHADLTLINLAAPLADGTQVVVPVKAPPGAAGSTAEPGTAPAGPVHLNVATLEQLDALPGVGPVTAQKIVDYRQKHGAFSSLEELDAIPGIGPARIEQLRDVAAP
jgi:competence protein ComEA